MKLSRLFSSDYHRTITQLAALMVFAANMLLNVGAVSAAPVPDIQNLGDQTLFLGDQASFSFNFSNTGPDIGYGPFIELALDTSGVDGATAAPLDGYGKPSVTAAGLTMAPVATIPVTGGTFVNPLTGETRTVPAGYGANDTIYIYALPFGSFSPAQTTQLTINVPTSNLADLAIALPITITPGFRDDEPSLNGPGFYSATPATGSITPILYSLDKMYLGLEDDTTTGPNHPHRYRFEVDIATGQTVSNLVVTDDLATSMQITGRDATHMFASTAAGGLGSNIFTAANSGGTAITTAPDGTLTYSFGSVTGVDGVDAVFEFEFYVPRDTSAGTQVLPQDATSGTNSVLATNTSNSSLDWTPIDGRDLAQSAVPASPSKSTLNHALEEQSIAIQKIAAAIDPTTGNPTTKIIPGTTLIRYTLNFQVSDYYAVQNVQINDVLADGLRLFTDTRGSVTAGIPTLAVNNAYLTGSPAGSRVNLSSAAFGGGTINYERRYTLQSALPIGTASDPTSFPSGVPTDPAFSAPTVGTTIDGSTLLNFDISAELIRRLGASAGRLVGGEINNDGSGPNNAAFAGPNLGTTTGTIVFYAEVSKDFSDDFPSSDRSVDQGDMLLNTVNDPTTVQRDGIIADQIRPADINAAAPTVIGIASDDSGVELEIGYGETSKTIERINAQTVPAQTLTNPPFSVQPGDRITYKLSYTLPIDSYEQLRLRDYPPLPVMPVGAASQYSLETGVPSYNAYTIAIAPDDTFFSTNSFVGTAVNLTTAAALTGATYSTAGNGSFSFATTPTVDGATVTAGMRILVKNQADTTQNGVYLATAPTSWLRATDMDIESEVESSQLYAATVGSTNANIYYVQSNNQFSLFNDTSARGQIIFEPFISTSTTLNEVLLNFGNFNNPSYSTVKLSVLLTLPVGSDPFSTDLLLTNQLRVNEASTNNGTNTVEDLRRYQLVRPNLAIQKGVVGANTTGFVLGGIAFTAPNAAANFSGGPVYTPTQALAIGARDIDLFDALDAGDEVRYAIVAQNSGKGDAFDTILNDTIPIEYNRATFNPATDLVLRRGDATQLTTSAAVNGFVRVATTTNLGGSFNAATGSGQFSNVPLTLIDGQKIIVGDRILVKDQTTASENGIYSVTAIDLNANTFTLTRSTDANTATALSGYRVAVAGGLSNADQHFQLSAVTTLNSDPVNAGAALGVRDYYTVYNSTTGNLQILLSDNYTAGNIGGASEDNRSGSLSRGLRTDQTNDDTAIINGSNTIIAMYDVILQPTVEPNQIIPNTASILSYSNSQGGPDYTNPANIPNASDPSDSAQVIVKLPLMAKTLVSTEVTTAGNNGTGGPDAQATIGEYMTYKVTLTVPEGVSTATQIVDTLDAGLAFVDVTGVTASSGLSFASGGLPTVSATPANTTINTFAGDAGRQIVFNLGTITNNTNVNNAAPETIEMSYRAVVLNTLANQQTQSRNNAAQLSWQNNIGTVISVSAGQSSSLTGSTSDVPTPVTIVEPTLTNLKDLRNVTQGETFPVTAGTPQRTRGDAGDTMEYRITIANPVTGSTTAYDASLSDPLPTSYFPGGFTISSVISTGTIRFNGTARAATPADFVITAGSLQFAAGLDVDIDPGATITILVQGAGFTGATGQLIDNIADLRWSSLDGTPGTRSSYNTNSTERTGADGEIGSGVLNDYRDTDNAVIESPPIVRKTLVSTSEAHTTGSNVAIGEIVRFRLVASLAEGTSANYQVQDFMPTGMSFLNDGTARWALVSDGGNVIASTTVGSVPSLGSPITILNGGISGDQANLNAITSSQIIGTFADANISTDANGAGTGDAVYADGADIFFRFGTLANTDNDTDVEYVVVEFNALVRNQSSNQAGTNLDNSMTILADTDNNGSAGYIDVVNDSNGDGVGTGEATIPATDADNNADVGANTAAQSTPATVTVVEPNLTINKQVIATTGSQVSYRITLTNPTATNASTGYNLRVSDALTAANLTLLNPTSLTATLAAGAIGATNNSSGNTVDFTIDVLPVGGSVTIDYSATVLTTPTGTTSIDNTANATDTSLPGLLGTGGDWAGTGISSSVPGASGSATGERTGQDGVAGALNDYAVRDTERLGSLGDRVYYDANANGAQGAIAVEPGLVGVPVTVTWAGPDNNFATTGDNAVITVNTGANGIWTVAGLPLGATQRYRVSVPTTFSGMGLTDVRDNGATNTNPDGVGVGISAITLTGATAATTNNRLQDFGYRGTASLGNRIYIDADGDGVQDTNGLEPSLPAVATTLLWAGPDNNFTTTADNLTFTQNSTNAATNYLYSNLPAGDFRVTVSATGGSGGVPDNMTLTDALDNSLLNTDPNGLGAGIIQTNLTTGENEVTIDFGYKGTASIGDYVWYDVNGDGVQDAGEPPIVGATVTLLWSGPDGVLNNADDVTFTTTTDATGKYLFPSLPVNGPTDPYRVTVTPPAAYPAQTYDKDGTGTANNSTLNLALTENNVDQDFGYRGTAQLGNFVWEDLNGNGRQDAGEPGIDSVAVELYFDLNNDGDFADAGETTPLASTTTAGGGLYSFTNLPYGNYQVVFGNGNGTTTYNRTVIDSAVATDATDSDADVSTGRTGTYTLSSVNANNQTVDAGLIRLVSLGDRVYYDPNNDGIQQPSELGIKDATVTVIWLGPNGAVGGGDDVVYPGVTTDSNGNWSLANLPPGSFQVAVTNLPAGVTITDSIDNGGAASALNPVVISTSSGVNRTDIDFGFRGNGSIGDHVFLDLNNNGTFDAGEGIANVTVTLKGDINGDGIDDSLTTTTDADGFYQFNNLRTSDSGVNYTVTIDTTDLPQDGAGNPLPNTVDPDTSGTGNNTSSLSLTTTTPSDQNQDFGYRGLGQIGDTTFLDVNSNNQPDAGEGISGVKVTLSGDLDGDGTAETFTSTTNASGVYDFSYLPVRTPAGTLINYTVTVDTSTLPASVTNTVDPDTANPGDSTSALTLPTTGAPVNLDQDFGYRGTGSVGDRIFLDVDNNSSYTTGEGIDNVTVTLTADVNGDGVAETFTTTTDQDGFYQFNNLPIYQKDGTTAVNYTVKVVTATLPTGVSNTVDPDSGLDSTSTLTLSTTNPSNPDQDFGYRGTASLGDRVWIDSNGDGVQDAVALEPSLPGISMQLTWAGTDGIFGNNDDVTSTLTTDSTGAYNFTGLPAGKFQVNVDTNSLPVNMSQTYDLDGTGTANQAERTLTQNEAATDLDFGYRGNASLGDRVWLDQNGNGIQEASEVGLPGVNIRATWYGSDGSFGTTDDIVFSTTTGADGKYLFDYLPANALNGLNPNYRVEVTGGIIAGLDLTDSIDNGGAVSPVNPVDIQVSPVEGNLLNDRRDIDFGYDGLSSLAGTVFRDDNNNGVQDVGEPGIGGVTLTLTGVDVLGNPYIDPSTGQPYVATTDATGSYTFPTVVPGTYTITEAQPGNYNDGIDSAGSLGGNAGNDVITGIPVGANQAGTAYNFGEIGTFIAGIVFRDDNRDGVLDASETTGLGGVTIQLYDSTGTTLIATTTTAADGSYRFDNIAIGSYQVRETQPGDYASSPTGPFAPNTRIVNVPAAGLPNQNFGEILASISGVVYIDANNDGLRDAADTGRIGNVPVTLTGTDINNNPINLTVYTDASGAYRFDNLFPSDASGYTVTEGSAAPYSDKAANPGTATGGSAGTTSDANTITGIGLTAGSAGVNYDFGEIQPSSTFISGSVYRDDNKNGLRETSELPIPATTIMLYDAGADGIFGNADDGPAQTATTDANGNYLFPNLITGRNYQVVETQPAAYGNSPAGPTTLIAVNALPAAGSSNNNFGELLGSLAGLVYFDANNNGAFDSGENGIAGTIVSLSGADINGNPVSLTTTTAADGSYRFDNLPAGSYIVTETQPAGYADGRETVGSSGGSTSVNDEISAITLSAGQNATSYNFGEVGVSVSGLIFYDTNRDGALDGSETLRIPNVSVQLIDKNGNVVATTTTAADGSYIFTNVSPGDYTIVEQQPTGYGDPLVGSYAPNSRPITVASTPIINQNFGDTLSTLAGSVYADSNNNGIREGSETGISGVPVRLDWSGPDGIFGTADDVTGLDTSTTGSNGGYLFSDLLTGVYRVVETSQPAPYTDGLETAGSDGGNTATNEQISAIPVAAGTDLTDYNFGEVPPANPFISGSVYIDSNNNGIRDPGEPGIPGVTVTLTGLNGGTVTTDANGNYVFINLTAGSNYTITETQPNEYGNGLENSSNTISIPSLPATGSSNNNFGEIPGSISGVVYFDADNSGTLTAGDTRLPGVTVSLQDGNGNPVNNPLTGQPYVVTTGADGSYLFENLPAGNYHVVETQPSSYNDGAENPGTGNSSTVNDRIDVTLAAGASSIDNNFAELGAALSGTVWVDTDRDGTIDGAEAGRISGVTIKLYDKNGNLVGTTTTAVDGSYSFTNLPPGDYTIVQEQPNAYGSSTPNTIAVSLTKTGLTDQNFGETLGSLSGMVYADVNRNGIHDAGEPGIPGVTVTLTGTDINGNSVNRTAITDVNGSYSFGDLLAGNYQLVETQPAGYNDGQEQVGSAGGTIPTNDTIATVPLGAGVNASDYNFGEVSASMSGTVWLDRDRDGSLDAGEPGIGTITIELRNNNGDLIATTTTNSDGSYSFIGLPGGDYQIIELQPNGYGSTTSNTISVTVPNDGLISNQNFGDSLGSINGAVYIDANADGVRDVGEAGISGVTINLTGTDLNGKPVTRMVTTDNNGAYSFGDLLAGSYTVIESQPANYGDGLDAIGSAGGSLSNDTAGNIVLTPGLDANGYNFGEGIPTAIVLAHFSASHEDAGVMLRWVTSVELNTWGFQVYRSTNAQRQDAVLVTPTLIVAQGRGQGGAQYEWLDTSAEAGVTYSYWLLETELDGQIHEYGPAQTALTTAADSGYRVLLPLVMR